MKRAICGASCNECPQSGGCKGCVETNGAPFGKPCFVAKYILTGGMENYQAFKSGLIDEINALSVDGMEKVTEIYPLVGSFVNLKYPLPDGGTVKFLKDDEVYLGAQVKNLLDDSAKSCFGVVARESFLLVCEYHEGCAEPQLVLYKRR